MKLKDLNKYILVNPEKIEVDSMDVIEDHFFWRPGTKNYRKSAIEFAITNKLPLYVTSNNAYEMLGRFVSVKCPICGKDMKSNSGGGSSDFFGRSYECKKCRVKANLTIPLSRGLSFQFDKKED